MDSSKKHDNPSPEESSNIISRIFYWWVFPIFKFGYQNDIETKDIYNTTKQDSSGPLGDELERNWEQEVKRAKRDNGRPSLLRAIRMSFFKSYAFYGVWIFLQAIIIKLMQPFILAAFIKCFDSPTCNASSDIGWMFGSAVVVLSFLNMALMHFNNLACFRIGMRCRIACCSLLYRKLLKLNRTAVGETASGQLVNLMSNDVHRFDFTSGFLHNMWIMPIQTIIATYIMYQSVGVAAFAGITAISIQAVLIQGYLSRLQGKYRAKIAVRTDSRMKLMTEITAGIQVIKMYAWEMPFNKMVALSRKYEINLVSKTSYIKGFSVALMVFTERATLFLTIITFVLLGHRLTADIVFPVAQLFNTIQLYMCILYPLAMASFAEAKVSVKRIEDFLIKEEKLETSSNVIVETEKCGGIKLTNVNASWAPNQIVDTLIDATVDIRPGMLCCVVGNVGAGKSSLLNVILKELPVRTGHLEVNGRISYASQEPWLFVNNVRNNILFGQDYVKNRYNDVINVCALERDLKQFSFGDKTLVGERGVSMSGGQRARMNLARAVYREADIYLFDDPLSAVDTQVGKHLFEKCIRNYLNNKTRILVTHQVQFLKQADLIIVINNGKIEKVGAFSDLNENELSEILPPETPSEEKENAFEDGSRPRLTSQSTVSSSSSKVNEDEGAEPKETEELIEKGAIATSTYMEYFNSGASWATILFLIILLIIAQLACNASDLWLTRWTGIEEEMYNNTLQRLQSPLNLTDTLFTTTGSPSTTETLPALNITDSISMNDTKHDSKFLGELTPNEMIQSTSVEHDVVYEREYYIYIYTLFILIAIILTTFRSLLFYKIAMNASIGLHNKIFSNVLQAPMRFFDTNPSGRILNRFSKDMGTIDEMLPKAMLDALQIFLVMSGILMMVFIVTPWMIIVAAVLAVIFMWTRVVYLRSAQNIKRLEGTTRAPVFSHVSASLYGLPTIRASNAQQMIIDEFDVLQDQHTGTWFLFLATSEAFGFYLDVISTAFLTILTYQFLIFNDGSTSSPDVGLVISQSLILTGMLQYGVRQTTEVASNMTSVERVLQYTKIEKEGPFSSLPGHKPPQDWPKQGQILFKNTYLKYVPEEAPILKNLNIKINAGAKVGIVGRTGAGKSSLIASLFRLAKIEGLIEIDGLDTKNIGLLDLRSKISIIPQEPILFSASIRYNLDPFDKCKDDVLWKALDNVELKSSVEGLDQNVSEGGSNFSAGQRQLLCLARAIVRNNKILVMDEATANVDPEFKDCTVITIAHRLNTIMDSDKVLVMDGGEAMEFDHPHLLLQNPDGYFTKMLREMGDTMVSKLSKVAEDAYKSKIEEIEQIETVNAPTDQNNIEH